MVKTKKLLVEKFDRRLCVDAVIMSLSFIPIFKNLNNNISIFEKVDTSNVITNHTLRRLKMLFFVLIPKQTV